MRFRLKSSSRWNKKISRVLPSESLELLGSLAPENSAALARETFINIAIIEHLSVLHFTILTNSKYLKNNKFIFQLRVFQKNRYNRNEDDQPFWSFSISRCAPILPWNSYRTFCGFSSHSAISAWAPATEFQSFWWGYQSWTRWKAPLGGFSQDWNWNGYH